MSCKLWIEGRKNGLVASWIPLSHMRVQHMQHTYDCCHLSLRNLDSKIFGSLVEMVWKVPSWKNTNKTGWWEGIGETVPVPGTGDWNYETDDLHTSRHRASADLLVSTAMTLCFLSKTLTGDAPPPPKLLRLVRRGTTSQHKRFFVLV